MGNRVCVSFSGGKDSTAMLLMMLDGVRQKKQGRLTRTKEKPGFLLIV